VSRRLFIIGTGGLAKEVAQLASRLRAAGHACWSSIDYLAQHPSEVGKPMPIGEVVGTDLLLESARGIDYAIGIGTPAIRKRIALALIGKPGLSAPNLVHPACEIDPNLVHFGMGNIVLRGASFTCDITVGDFNVFNPNCTVGHDSRIGSFNVICPGCNISGNTKIGDTCLLGTGSQVLEKLTLTSEVTVGGGALVAKSISVAGVYVGVPARFLK
jgi:sugar O-acyltransferase (sialic acid O-acetyltransferase NeuD family)